MAPSPEQKDVPLPATLCPGGSQAPVGVNSGCTFVTNDAHNDTVWQGSVAGLNPLSGGLIVSVTFDDVLSNVTRGASSKTFPFGFVATVLGNEDSDAGVHADGWVTVYNASSDVGVTCTDSGTCTDAILLNMNEVRPPLSCSLHRAHVWRRNTHTFVATCGCGTAVCN